MRVLSPLILAVTLAFPAFAQAPKVALDTPLIVDGNVTVDAGDLEAALLRAPPERRNDVRTSYDRVASIADGIFVTRSLAERARTAGLDKDPVIQRRLKQAQEAALADLYMQKLETETASVDLEQRARELYRADQAKFVRPEHVSLQHILIDLKGRTREMALERARDIYQRATSGKEDFLALAGRYSDDPDKKRNGGDLGFNSPNSFVPPVRDALNKMKVKGEISEPIESEFGYHLVRYMDRQPAEPQKFEAVRSSIIRAERERLQKQRLDAVVQEIRSSPTVVVNRANVDSLVIPIDHEALKRAQEAAAAKK